jgi:hypothetical protein
MGKFLLRRLVYLVVLVIIATASTFSCAAAAPDPGQFWEIPPPHPKSSTPGSMR